MEKLTVRQFLDSLPCRLEVPVIGPESSLREVVGVMVKGHRRRIVYVVDADGKLKGAITLGELKDVIFHYYLNARVRDAIVVTEHITELFASEKADDVMEVDLVVCHEHETLHDVIVKMSERNIKAVPVLDREDRVIADLDILDLLELWLKKGNEAF